MEQQFNGGPPDVHALYAASSVALAGARRRRMPHQVPAPALAGLGELDPRASIAKLAKEEADPRRKYDHTTYVSYPSLELTLGSRAYKGKSSLRRNASQWSSDRYDF